MGQPTSPRVKKVRFADDVKKENDRGTWGVKKVRFADDVGREHECRSGSGQYQDARKNNENDVKPMAILRLRQLAKYFLSFSPSLQQSDDLDSASHNARIALACVLGALEGCSRHDIPQEYRQEMVNTVYWNDQIDCTDARVYDHRIRLRGMFQRRMDQYIGMKKSMAVRANFL